MQSGHSDTCTEGIRVRVGAQFMPQPSDPAEGSYVYAYRVIIDNEGDEAARLISRHWVIRDANNELREVRGQGVVGETPYLGPGDRFTYTSGCPLTTEWGTMEGSYLMERDDGSRFDAKIGLFFLAPNVAPLPQPESGAH